MTRGMKTRPVALFVLVLAVGCNRYQPAEMGQRTKELGVDATPTPAVAEEAAASSAVPPSKGGPVDVKGYTKKDGTAVAPHSRSAPERRR